jgi:aspartyl-tRNA(Asn)/glutamyl-tRNA(Gln) amidotransferase subunit B
MSQGSMRFDVNISIRPKGTDKLGTRTETKNLNSFRFMEKAIALEVERQIDVLESGGKITQETRLYDAEKDFSRAMRSKEEANDYRYFPCPDLLPVEFDDSYIQEIKATLPELPDARCKRFVKQYGLSDYDATLIANQADLSSYFEVMTKISCDAKLSANWVLGELSANLNSNNISLSHCPISAEELGQLVLRAKDNTISSSGAKKVFSLLWKGKTNVDQIIEEQGLKQVSDTAALEKLVDVVLAGMQDQITQYKEADGNKRKKLMGGFMGPLMKASKGQGNPKLFNEILSKKLNN